MVTFYICGCKPSMWLQNQNICGCKPSDEQKTFDNVANYLCPPPLYEVQGWGREAMIYSDAAYLFNVTQYGGVNVVPKKK